MCSWRRSSRRTAIGPGGAARWPGCSAWRATSWPPIAGSAGVSGARQLRSSAGDCSATTISPRIADRIDGADTARTLYAALDALPEPERAVLELVAVDELAVSEAAAALGIRAVPARVPLHRARRTLRAVLAAPPPQADPENRARA